MYLPTGFRVFEFNLDFWLIVRVLSVRFLLVGKRLQVEVKRGFQSFSHHQLGGGGEREGGFLLCSTCRNSFDNEYVGSNLVFPFNAHICHAAQCLAALWMVGRLGCSVAIFNSQLCHYLRDFLSTTHVVCKRRLEL